MKTEKQKADIYDKIVNIINQALEDEESGIRDIDFSEIVEEIQHIL